MMTTETKALRAQVQEFAFRNRQIRLAAYEMSSSQSDCSAAAAMVLTVALDTAELDQIPVAELRTHCLAAGITLEEFTAACGELAGMHAFQFLRSRRDSSAIVKFWSLPGYVEGLDTAEALQACNPTPSQPTFTVVAYPQSSVDASNDGRVFRGLSQSEALRLQDRLNADGWIICGLDPE